MVGFTQVWIGRVSLSEIGSANLWGRPFLLWSIGMEQIPYSQTELGNSDAVRAFAYKGKKGGFIGMVEDEVKAALRSAFEKRAYEVVIHWGQKGGPDFEAKLGSSRVLIEAKGEGSYRQMLGNYFSRLFT